MPATPPISVREYRQTYLNSPHLKAPPSYSQHTSNALAPSSGIPTADVNCAVYVRSNFETEIKRVKLANDYPKRG